MRLRLNLCDVDLQLKITYYKVHEEDGLDWTKDELTLHGSYINYEIDSELLMEYEVCDLCDALEDLLTGKMKKDCSMRFAEPDIELKFSVAKRLYSEPGKIIYTKGYCDVDIYAEFFVNFWCSDGLGSNQFRMIMDRDEIGAFSTYLRYTTGKIKLSDPEIQKYIQRGMILSE